MQVKYVGLECPDRSAQRRPEPYGYWRVHQIELNWYTDEPVRVVWEWCAVYQGKSLNAL